MCTCSYCNINASYIKKIKIFCHWTPHRKELLRTGLGPELGEKEVEQLEALLVVQQLIARKPARTDGLEANRELKVIVRQRNIESDLSEKL